MRSLPQKLLLAMIAVQIVVILALLLAGHRALRDILMAGVRDDARDGECDIALLPSHITRVAVADWGMQLVARFAQTWEVQLVTLPGTSLDPPDGLRGRRIAAIDPLSITTLMRQALLEFVPASAGAGISRSPFVAADIQDFAPVESYAAEVRRLLAQKN